MSGFFDKDEQKKISTQFWQDGVSRRVTCDKEWRAGKTDPTKELCYIVAYDVDTKNSMTFLDFAFLNALKTLPEGQKYENAILKVTPQKTGERTWQDKTYDQFSYDIQPTGEFAEPKTAVGEINF